MLSSTSLSCLAQAYHVNNSGRSIEYHFSLLYVFAIRSKNLKWRSIVTNEKRNLRFTEQPYHIFQHHNMFVQYDMQSITSGVLVPGLMKDNAF